MSKIYFKFLSHPGDLFRGTDVVELPDPNSDLENFLIYFLSHYQSDKRIAYIDDLSKVIDNEFEDENEKLKLLSKFSINSFESMQLEINTVDEELKKEAFENFYKLILYNKIEIIYNNEK